MTWMWRSPRQRLVLRVDRPGSGRETAWMMQPLIRRGWMGWMGSAVLQAWPAFQTLADPPNNGTNGSWNISKLGLGKSSSAWPQLFGLLAAFGWPGGREQRSCQPREWFSPNAFRGLQVDLTNIRSQRSAKHFFSSCWSECKAIPDSLSSTLPRKQQSIKSFTRSRDRPLHVEQPLSYGSRRRLHPP